MALSRQHIPHAPPLLRGWSRHRACDLRAVSCILAGISALINCGLNSQPNSYSKWERGGVGAGIRSTAWAAWLTNQWRFALQSTSLPVAINVRQLSPVAEPEQRVRHVTACQHASGAATAAAAAAWSTVCATSAPMFRCHSLSVGCALRELQLRSSALSNAVQGKRAKSSRQICCCMCL